MKIVSLIALGVPPTLAFFNIASFESANLLLFFDIFDQGIPSHDARHFAVDPDSLLLISDRAAFEGVDGDELKPAEQFLVVDLVVAPLKEVVLIGVVVLDEHFPIGTFLTKEGAGMRNYLVIEELGT